MGYDHPPLSWLRDPPPEKVYYDSNLWIPDFFDIWSKSVKRPTTDRHFVPKDPVSEDTKDPF